MFDTQKRIFAGKNPGLHSEPLCPCITNNSGYLSLSRSSERAAVVQPHRRKVDSIPLRPQR